MDDPLAEKAGAVRRMLDLQVLRLFFMIPIVV